MINKLEKERRSITMVLLNTLKAIIRMTKKFQKKKNHITELYYLHTDIRRCRNKQCRYQKSPKNRHYFSKLR